MIYDELAEKFWGLKLDPSISLDSFLEVRIEIESDLQTLQKYIYLSTVSIYLFIFSPIYKKYPSRDMCPVSRQSLQILAGSHIRGESVIVIGWC